VPLSEDRVPDLAVLLRGCSAGLQLVEEHVEPVVPAGARPVSSLLTTDDYGVAYAYNPRQAGWSNGAYHLVVQTPLRAGRLKREPGDALCKPAGKFWGLDHRRTEEEFQARPCARCLALRGRGAPTGVEKS
jgi:hypothetical protein